jgi:hypothetical protein
MADEITLLESFDRGREGWRYYDVYDPTIREAIHDQRHVDFRDFTGSPTENWNGGSTVQPRPENGNLKSVRLNFVTGGFSLGSDRGDFAAVDLVTDFEPDDHFSVSFPSFPLSKINLGASYIRLGSYTGVYDASKAIFLPLDQSLVPLTNGNSEYRVLLSSLDQGNNFDPTQVRNLYMWFVATANGTLDINAMRTLDKKWKSSGLGINTLDGSLGCVPNRTGGTTIDFEQPILWHSSEPAGTNDPRPIDADFVVPFHTSAANTGTNRLSLYFREVTEDFMTQLDLDGMTMAELNGKDQPDIGAAKYNQRTIGELNRYKLSALDGETIFSLERTPDFLSASWIEFTLQWGVANSITIQDTEGNGYNFAIPALTTNTNYAFATYLEENKARAALYKIDSSGNYSSTIFDTTLINDDTAFQRRKGRVGWFANLNDGDARILAFAPNGITYAEYRSQPYSSQTPVVGAELFASNSPSNELFEEFQTETGLSSAAVPTRDTTRSLSGESWKIATLTDAPTVIVTQPFVMTDYLNSVIEFDVFVPSSVVAEDIGLSARVLGQNFNESYPMITPVIFGDQWQHVKIDFLFGTPAILPGKIQVEIGLTGTPTVPSAFWIDNMSIRERTVVWDGRAVVDDPWKSNDAKWQPFRDNYARENGGVVFDKRGSNLQVRGRARKQSATISRVQYKPRYAELGRFSSPKITQSYRNLLDNPDGDTSTGWEQHPSGVISTVTDAGHPALNMTGTNNATIRSTKASATHIVTPGTYFVGARIRRLAAGLMNSVNIGVLFWGSGASPGWSSGSPDMSHSLPQYVGQIIQTSTDYTILGAYEDITQADINYMTGLVGSPLKLGILIFINALTSPTTQTYYAYNMTLARVEPTDIRPPLVPFSGRSAGGAWTNGVATQSVYAPFDFSPTPSFGVTNAGLTATLTATADKAVANFEWNFGDGEKAIGSKVIHTYPVSGVYPVSLVATDTYGNQGTFVNTVAV